MKPGHTYTQTQDQTIRWQSLNHTPLLSSDGANQIDTLRSSRKTERGLQTER